MWELSLFCSVFLHFAKSKIGISCPFEVHLQDHLDVLFLPDKGFQSMAIGVLKEPHNSSI